MLHLIRNRIRVIVISIRMAYFRKIWHMDIHPSALISYGARLDKTFPRGVHIGEESYFSSGSCMLSHDFCRGIHTDTFVGKRCFIGVGVIILPGIKIGDEVIIGAGAVVTKDIPAHSIAVGNPAKVIKTGISTGKYGKLK